MRMRMGVRIDNRTRVRMGMGVDRMLKGKVG